MTIERGNSKHSVHLDEEMAKEVKGEIRGQGLGFPAGHLAEPTHDDRDPDYRDLRARIGQFVSLTEFPATGARIVNDARHHDAPDDVLQALGRLDAGQRYTRAQELWKSLDLSSGNRF